MFKKIFRFTLLSIAAAATFSFLKFANGNSPLFCFADEIEIYFYDGSFCEGVSASFSEYPFIKGITGESCVISCDDEKKPSDIAKKLGGKILFSESTEEGVSYYGYSDKVKYKKRINGKVVNFQIFCCESRMKIGLPLIFGSF